MALFLAIETAGTTCGAALFQNEILLAEHSLYVKNVHDKVLATVVKQLFEITNFRLEELNAVCISAGPGSFTGLRIGYSFVKGLLFGTDVRLVEVPTLYACAYAAKEFAIISGCESIYAIISSHKDIIYTQKFTSNAEPLNEVRLMSVNEFSALEDVNENVVCGSGAIVMPHIGKQLSGLNRLTPRFIGKLGLHFIQGDIYSDVEKAEPLYSQDFVVK